MMDANQQAIDTATETVKQTVDAVAKTVKPVVAAATATTAAAATPAARKSRPAAAKAARKAPAKAVVAAARTIKSRTKTSNKPRARKATTVASQVGKDLTMNFDAINWMNSFGDFTALPGAEQMKNLFGEARAKSEQVVQRSKAAAEDMADLARGNVEAMVSSAKIAATGAQTLGKSLFERGRESVEQAGEVVKSLSEAKSPTDFFQLQSELARTSFDRIVAETSRLTEEMVKLAGETVQPISSRMAIAAERVNKITA